MAEATLKKDSDVVDQTTPSAGYSAGQVLQLADGRAAVVQGLSALTSGDQAGLKTEGKVTLAKTSGVCVIKGDLMYWDRSANTATPLKAMAGADFPIGCALEDVASTTATVLVDLNTKPVYIADIFRGPTASVAVANGTLTMLTGCAKLSFTTATEAQKMDILSLESVPVDIPFVVEGRVAIYDVADSNTMDFNIGIANDTHASDADSITESVFFHVDGNDLLINCESDDGTTEVAATNSTKSAVDDTYFDFRIDCRDIDDIQLYVNAVNVLPASVFKLDKATGPMKLLAHLEKSSNDTAGEVRVAHLAIRATDLTS